MALTGELSDLSLAELIEFFCNQRKTGCLKVVYVAGAGSFYLKSGAVVHARFEDLRGIDAVFYALTQSNASFTFTPDVEAPELSINQPWTSVVLEGLRRMDEGVAPLKPSAKSASDVPESAQEQTVEQFSAPSIVAEDPRTGSADSADNVKSPSVFLTQSERDSFAPRRWNPAVVMAAVVVLLAAVGVPWGWYTHKKATRFAGEASAAPATAQPATVAVPTETQSPVPAAQEPSPESADAAEIAKRQREARARERLKELGQAAPNVANKVDSAAKPNPFGDSAKTQSTPAPANRRVTVQVTYDENGRVTQASGGDATALRIARQKRFPAGKPGSATVTIPIN